ncbi:MAG: DUF4185 domain-containing protein [Actinomycetia bacterium]|nr:DUF4185 domain-containing protein [Actinomycetes bacterium]
MTWAENDYQYSGLCDGTGWEHLPEYSGKNHNTRIFIIEGNVPNHSFKYLQGYPKLEYLWPPSKSNPKLYSRYYGFGIIAIDGFIYQFLSTPKVPFGPPGNSFIGAKLIYSPDNGRSWMNQDGTSPVYWEEWEERNHENMIFFDEPGETFSLLSVLQMGRNYEHNRDDYVYIYAPNGNEDGSMNQLVMLRVKKNKILNRSEYEYFASLNPDGTANWSTNMQDRGIVHTFPSGWVNWKIGDPYGGHPYAWHPSIVYNRQLNVYMMANWGMGVGSDGDWFDKPSYLGFWTAPKPWGPWTQVHEETAWKPNSDINARAYQPQISPKWISDDGKSFWLVWTDFRLVGVSRPYYAFNCQKVLILTK